MTYSQPCEFRCQCQSVDGRQCGRVIRQTKDFRLLYFVPLPVFRREGPESEMWVSAHVHKWCFWRIVLRRTIPRASWRVFTTTINLRERE